MLFVNPSPQSRTLVWRSGWSARSRADIEVLALPALHLAPYDAKDIAERDALSPRARSPAVFALANQFKTADAVVLACPFWDRVPSMVRNYLERLSPGLTFHYGSDNYPVGDCRPQRLCVCHHARRHRE